MKKNDRFIGVCEGYNDKGLGVVRHEGFVFFVKDIARQDQVEILVLSLKKNYGFGKVLRWIKKSPCIKEAECSVYRLCGGCQLQHLTYDEQLYFKTKKVEDCFKSIAKKDIVCDEIIGADHPWRYRNKVQVPVQEDQGTVKIGFYRNHTNDLVEFDDCLVQSELSNTILQFCKQKMMDLRCAEKIRHLLIKHAHNTNEVLLTVVVKEYPFEKAEELFTSIKQEFNEIKSIVVNINTRKDNVLLSNQEKVVFGTGVIEEKLDDFHFQIASKSFYQINPEQTSKLYQKVKEFSNLKKTEVAVDLYCGTGTIGTFISKDAKKVIGVEIVEAAIENAKKNIELNQIENIEFICADATEGANEILSRNEKIDVVIVDPPRKGCDIKTLEAVVAMKPDRIVYVSCDPSTLARDVRILAEKGYELSRVQPVDMFPMTHHVETVALLSYNQKYIEC